MLRGKGCYEERDAKRKEMIRGKDRRSVGWSDDRSDGRSDGRSVAGGQPYLFIKHVVPPAEDCREKE